jgi:hypothetical protein
VLAEWNSKRILAILIKLHEATAEGNGHMTTIKYPTEQQVRAHAYQIYLERGGQHGHDMDDWLQAEYELVQLPIQKIAELEMAPSKKTGAHTLALASLVQVAMLLGTDALPRLNT